jgi:hypothetical protein
MATDVYRALLVPEQDGADQEPNSHDIATIPRCATRNATLILVSRSP